MSVLTLRPYQKNVLKNVTQHLENNKRCCVSLATGGGKTVIFSELVNELQGRTLILVHREELVLQTSKTLNKEHCIIMPKTKYKGSNIAVAMVQTLNNRLKKGEIDINTFDNIIVDECHRGEFMKVVNTFNGNVIGFTATPNYEKVKYIYKCIKCGTEGSTAKKCCGRQKEKYKDNIPLSKYYHTMISGVEINELIEQEYLVPDENLIFEIDEKKLVWNAKIGDYTEESINATYGSSQAIKHTIDVFKSKCWNKKTIIFNPNTLVNKLLYNAMLIEGLNVKMYDSNNSEENRIDLINWFKNESDAILLNVQVFTTGFDCTDVECVFLNKKTHSINLYLQMVGRGGRITDKIFKPKFTVVDMGNNNELFGKWSDSRDWGRYFYYSERTPVGKPKPASVSSCKKCEAIISSNCLTCSYCGAEKVFNNGTVGRLNTKVEVIIPKPQKIVDYCFKNDLDCNDARKITIKYIIDMFEYTSYETFKKYNSDKTLFHRAQNFVRPYYFAISNSQLKGNRNRKLSTFTEQLIIEIEKSYDNRS